jgi:hypothetical protein
VVPFIECRHSVLGLCTTAQLSAYGDYTLAAAAVSVVTVMCPEAKALLLCVLAVNPTYDTAASKVAGTRDR